MRDSTVLEKGLSLFTKKCEQNAPYRGFYSQVIRPGSTFVATALRAVLCNVKYGHTRTAHRAVATGSCVMMLS